MRNPFKRQPRLEDQYIEILNKHGLRSREELDFLRANDQKTKGRLKMIRVLQMAHEQKSLETKP